MINIDRSVITSAGSALINSGDPINITSIKTGSGTYTAGEDIASRTALKIEQDSYTPSSVSVDGSVRTVSGIVSNYDPVTETAIVTTTYTITELGLFATVGGTEILFAIAISYTGAVMPAYTGSNKSEMVISWVMSLSSTQQITVTSAGAAALATDLATLSTNTTAELAKLAADFAPAFDATSTYALDDLCTYQNVLYKCTTAITVAAAWDSTKWTAVAVDDLLGTAASADKTTSITNGGTGLPTSGTVYSYTFPVAITADGTTPPADTRSLWVYPEA